MEQTGIEDKLVELKTKLNRFKSWNIWTGIEIRVDWVGSTITKTKRPKKIFPNKINRIINYSGSKGKIGVKFGDECEKIRWKL
jgi:hypothetical protein